MLTNVFQFFTIWIIILTIFSEYTNKYFNLTSLSLLVLIIGSIFSFIYPKYFVVTFLDNEYKIEGLFKIIFADIGHLILFLYNYNYYGFSNNNIVNSLLLIIIYISTIDFIKIYKFL